MSSIRDRRCERSEATRLTGHLCGAWLLGFAALAMTVLLLAAPASAFAPEQAGPASTAAYGARCIGAAHDDTAAFQAAIDTGRTVYAPALGGACRITRPLVLRTPGQIVTGDGRARTRLVVEPGFSGAGVFVAASGEPGPVWRDLAVQFVQPDVPDSAKLVRYPPAFMVRGTPRFEIGHVGCYLATTCIDMTGNTGGATVDDLQMSAFETGIDIDGALDTVRLLSIHAWPFGAAGSRQITQMYAGVTWLRIGKVDDFKIVDGLFLGGIGMAFRATPLGAATGSITNTDFDGEHRGIVMSAGNMSVTGGYFASGASPADQQVVLTGGTLGITGATMGCSSGGHPTELAAIEVDGPVAFLTLEGSPSLVCGDDDRPILAVKHGTAIFSGNTILLTPNRPYRFPKIETTGPASRLTAIGNRVFDKGTGEGVFIAIGTDNSNRVIGNAAPGWRSTLAGRTMPAAALLPNPGVYFGN